MLVFAVFALAAGRVALGGSTKCVDNSGLCVSPALAAYYLKLDEGHSIDDSLTACPDVQPTCVVFPAGSAPARTRVKCSVVDDLSRDHRESLCKEEERIDNCKSIDSKCLVACSLKTSAALCDQRADCHKGESPEGEFACLDGAPVPDAPALPPAPDVDTWPCTEAPKRKIMLAHYHLHNGIDIESESPYGGVFRPLTESEDAAEFTPDMIVAGLNSCPVHRYAAVKHTMPAGPLSPSITIADTRYPIPERGDNPGVQIIPVSDDGSAIFDPRALSCADESACTEDELNAAMVEGHALIDDFIRNQMQIADDTPMWTTISYTHNEDHEASDPEELIGTVLASELRQTHRGAYVGDGVTLNSPEGYHSNRWGNRGYHVNVHIWSVDGMDNDLLSRNCFQWGLALNNNVKFPGDYKNDFFKQHHLANLREFGSGFLRGDPTYRNAEWATYCAEHITSVENMCLNVAWNEASFIEFFGDDGAEVFEAAKTKAEAQRQKVGLTGDMYALQDIAEADLGVPLYKRDQGIESPATETRIGRGFYYRPLSTAELLRDVVAVYYPLDKLMDESFSASPGLAPVTINGIIQAFREKIVSRNGLDSQELRNQGDANDANLATSPIGGGVSAASNIDAESRYDQLTAPALMALHAAADMAHEGALETAKGVYAQQMSDGGVALCDKARAVFGAKIDASRSCSPSSTEAYDWARHTMADSLLRAVYAGIAPGKVEWNGPPKSAQLIVLGLLKTHPHVKMQPICTTVHHSEISKKFSAKAWFAASSDVKDLFKKGGKRMSNIHMPAAVSDFNAFAEAFNLRNAGSGSGQLDDSSPASTVTPLVALFSVVAAAMARFF